MIHNMIARHQGVSLFCGIGERCREGEELYRKKKEAGVLPNRKTDQGVYELKMAFRQ
jgi:F-type H+-transporting ATPase subunit beta